ncbi:MAG: zinc-ribbon domain-containing protein [Parasporobacterium sp.]|nr:zinc-ribbon domain-containing protein [Parasporobacterium sp.]
MFNNVSSKIKISAWVVLIIGIIASIVLGIICISTGAQVNQLLNYSNSFFGMGGSPSGSGTGLILGGIAIIIFGSIMSYVFALLVRGFGQIVFNTQSIASHAYGNNQRGQNSAPASHPAPASASQPAPVHQSAVTPAPVFERQPVSAEQPKNAETFERQPARTESPKTAEPFESQPNFMKPQPEVQQPAARPEMERATEATQQAEAEVPQKPEDPQQTEGLQEPKTSQEQPVFCGQCGAKNEASYTFCMKCGSKL